MNSVKITHFFDVIKKEHIFEDQSDVPPVLLDPNNVKQEYHYKEELDVAWDERDNDYDKNQENQNLSNDLSQKLSLPIVLVERLSDALVNKHCVPDKNENGYKNIIKGKLPRKSYAKYYRKCCPDCNKTILSVKWNRCKNCGTLSRYECGKCKEQLPTYKDMFFHLTKKCLKEGTYYACFKCNYKSTIRYKVSVHLKRVHSIVVSLNCIKGLKSQNVQKVIASTAELHKCPKCAKQFRKLPPLLRHMQHCGQANYDESDNLATLVNGVQDKCFHYCTKCKKTVKNDKVGSFRLKICANCNSKLSFKCKKCNNIFQSYSTIHQHLNTVHAVAKDVLKCPECDFQTPAISYLSAHVKNKHIIKTQVCPECGGEYKNSYYFQRHSRRCKKEPIFQCDYCSYRTKRKKNIINHIFCLHTVENEIDCSECD